MIRTRTLVLATAATAALFASAAGDDFRLLASGSAAVQGAKPAEGFKAMLATVDAAQVELQNGKPDAFKALWSRRDDITLSGGFGGTIEKGWTQSAGGSTGSGRSSRRGRTPSSGSWLRKAATSATWCSSSTSATPSPVRRSSRRATTA